MSANIMETLQHDTIFSLINVNSTLYAARQSGLYRSIDGGLTWTNAFHSLEDMLPLTVTAVTAYQNAVFAGVKGAVLRSYDAGESWTIIGLATPAPDVVALAISPNFDEDGIVVAGTIDDGVFVSTDRGSTWVAWNFGLIDAHVQCIVFSPSYAEDHLILAGTETGIFASKNGGRGWIELDFPMDVAPVVSLAFSSNYADDGLIYAGTEANGLSVSTDRGAHWSHLNNGLISGTVSAILVEKNHWLLLENRIIYSDDNGWTWKLFQHPFPSHALAMTIALNPVRGMSLIVGFADGEMMSTF